MIAIIDYGAGNVESVRHAFEKIGVKSKLTRDRVEILGAQGVVLPGVGAFGEAMRQLKIRGLMDTLRHVKSDGQPFLGICIGQQLMFEKSEESPGVGGLKFMEGEVVKIHSFNTRVKTPHMGWNQLEILQQDPLFAGLPEKPWFYFVHSYYVRAKQRQQVLASVQYGESQMDVAVRDGKLWAVQFHPEKSGESGLMLLENFVSICKEGR